MEKLCYSLKIKMNRTDDGDPEPVVQTIDVIAYTESKAFAKAKKYFDGLYLVPMNYELIHSFASICIT